MSNPPHTVARESPQERRRRLEALLRKKAEQARSFPLSFAQQRLWLLDQLEPGNPVYNIPLAVRMRGVLDLGALRRTLSTLIARHETLRTRIVARDGQPLQVVDPIAEYDLPVIDLEQAAAGSREADLLALARVEVQKPFRLDAGPLFRAALLRVSAHEHLLVAAVHHIIADDWSMGVLLREVTTLYHAYHGGQASPLQELPIQYADYAVWQRERLQGATLEALLDYWRPKLQGVADLALPTDRPHPQQPTSAGGTETALFPLSLAVHLRDVARRAGATLYMTMLAAFQTLLHYYSGQDDIAVGSPIAARLRAETEGLFGFFANTLVLRSNLSGDPSFLDLLGQVRATALAAFAHQEIPFERLVEALNPDRNTGRHPLFQVAFALQNAPWPEASLPGLTLTPLALDTGTSKFDLTVMARETRDALAIEAEYRSQLFDPDTIRRILRHYRNLLEAIAAQPARRLSELSILDVAERDVLLAMGRAAPRPYPHEHRLHQFFEAQAGRTPEAVAVSYEQQQLTYRQLNEQANRLARRLRALGVGPNVIVGLLVERSMEMVVGLLAILKAGGAYLPLDPGYPAERVAFMLTQSATPILLTQQRFRGRCASFAGRVITLDDEQKDFTADDAGDLVCPTGPDHAAYVIYTSGSTGQPKGVVIPHRAIVNHMQWMAEEFPLEPQDAVLQKTPFSFDASVWEFHAPLMCGARLVMARPGGHLDPAYLAEVIRREKITILQLVPTLLQMLVAEPRFAQCASLRRIFVGGEALPQELVRRTTALLSAEVCNLYGPTEAAIDATSFRWDGRADRPIVPIGRPIANTWVYVLNPRREAAPVGVPGELYIGGTGLALGYLNRPDLTAARFVPDPFSADPAARLYRTGDQVRWMADGNLEFLGRVDQQVKIRGFRIELGEIESLLRRHPAIRDAVVAPWDAGSGQQELAAYCVLRDGALTLTQAREYLRTSLPDYMLPSALVALDAIPVNPSGKVDYRGLPRPARERSEATTYVAPRTPDEEALADIWREVLRLEAVGVNDNFFSLGGHSLLATQIMSRVERRLGVALPLGELFRAATIAGLAESAAAARAAGRTANPTTIPRASREGPLPASLTQEALWFLDRLEPDRPTYTVYPTMRIRGPLDVPILERALSEIARRHEALRTRFPEVAGRPVQVIDPPAPWPLEVLDLSALPESERTPACHRRIAQETSRAIDLQRGPLIRIMLIKLGPGEHVLVAAAHHIIYDGWSLAVMTRELTAIYRAYQSGQASPLAELPIQYVDFAAWQRQYLQGATLERLLGYWARQLADVPPLNLPADFPRPAIRSTRGATLPCDLAPELSAAVRDFSQRLGVTPFMTLLAAFQALLARYSGQEDFAVGSPVANRSRPETEPLIGYFINMLVLRAELSGTPTFRELVGRVQRTALDAYEHQELTLDRVVDAVKPPRDPSRHPLFQVMFVLQNNDPPSLSELGLDVQPFDGPPAGEAAFFELTLAFGETAQGFAGSLNFNTDLFSAETARQLAGHFQTLLAAALADPDRPLASLPLLSADEERRLLLEWGGAGEDAFTESVHSQFEHQARQTPDAPALVEGQRVWTYRELDCRANQLAHHLQSLGVEPESLVALRLPRSADAILAILAVLKAGGAYLPLDPQSPAQRLAFMLDDAGARVLLTHTALRSDLPAGIQHVVCLDAEAATIERCSASRPPTDAGRDQLAYVIYTSGSTGRPKGVMIAHRALANYTQAAIRQYGITAADRVLQFASLSFDAHVEEIFPCLTQGGTLLLRSDEMLDARQFLQRCAEWRLTFVTLPTGFWHELTTAIAAERLTLPPTLRAVVIGGERALPERVAAWFGSLGERVRLFNTYGPTEATVVATAAELRVADGRGQRVPIGRPLLNSRAYVLDRRQQLVPPGACGELYIGGASLARGYLRHPELTAEKFLADPFATSSPGFMYRSGDVVRWRGDGQLEYVGRSDDQVKIRGFRIEPGEIERALREHPLLTSAAVVMRERGPGDLQLVAYVAASSATRPTAAELRDFLAARIPDFMIPAAFVLLDALPSTSGGKVDRQSLPAPEWGSAMSDGAFLAPHTPTERQLAEIWADVLQAQPIGAQSDFFALGGNSLLAVRLISRVRSDFAVDLPLTALFAAPRLAELARKIVEFRESGATVCADAIAARQHAGPVPIAISQQRYWFLHHLFPGQPVTNLHAALPLTGDLDVAVLERVVQELVRRHAMLRTTFAVDGEGRPLLVIASDAAVTLPIADLSGLPAEEREQAVREYCTQQGSTPIDLCRGPLFRLGLLRLGPAEHVLVITTTHVAIDGWAVQVLFQEIAQLYDAFKAGRASPLAELPIQYADYAVWQREYLQGETLTRLLDYWRERLTGVVSPQLPCDRPWRAGTPHRMRARSFAISAELRARLERFCRQEDVTLFTLMLTAFKVLLQRYSDAEEIAVIVPTANRRRRETQGVVGLFVNYLVLRTDMRGDPAFPEQLRRVRQTTLDGFDHEALPFEIVVRELAPDSHPLRLPLVQVIFNYLQPISAEQVQSRSELQLGYRPTAIDPLATRADMRMHVTANQRDLTVLVDYDRDLFDTETIARLEERFVALLSGIAADPARPISQFPLPGDGQWRRPTPPSANDGETASLFQQAPLLQEIAVSLLSPPTAGPQSLVPLRTNGSRPPLFCIHGLGGHVAAFMPLARALAPERPVYALQGQGLEPGQTPHDRIEGMAEAYLREIRDVQPHGPYYLAGWSLGGLIALEAARQLNAAGETAALVALFDTHLSLAQFQAFELDDQSVIRWIAPHLGIPPDELRSLPLDQQWQRIADAAQLAEGIGAAEIRRLAAVCRAHLAAASRYTPQPYEGPVVLFRAQEGDAPGQRRWRTLCPHLESRATPGDHYSMLRAPHVEQLAASLEGYLTAASDEFDQGGRG